MYVIFESFLPKNVLNNRISEKATATLAAGAGVGIYK